jgi:shikimate kinase
VVDRLLLVGMMGAGKTTVGKLVAARLGWGGAVLDPENRALIGHAGTVVWLRAELDTLVRRVGSGVSRPLLGDDPRSALTFLMAKRYPLYQDVADVVIDVDGLRPDEVADSVVAARHVPEGRVR